MGARFVGRVVLMFHRGCQVDSEVIGLQGGVLYLCSCVL